MAKQNEGTKTMLEAIKLERQRLAEEVASLEQRIIALDETLATYGVKNARPRLKAAPPMGPSSEPLHAQAITRGTPIYRGMKQVEAAFNYLSKRGEAVHADAIATALLMGGIDMRGTEQLSNDERCRRLKQSLVTSLHRDPRFKRTGRNIFALKKENPEEEEALKEQVIEHDSIVSEYA